MTELGQEPRSPYDQLRDPPKTLHLEGASSRKQVTARLRINEEYQSFVSPFCLFLFPPYSTKQPLFILFISFPFPILSDPLLFLSSHLTLFSPILSASLFAHLSASLCSLLIILPTTSSSLFSGSWPWWEFWNCGPVVHPSAQPLFPPYPRRLTKQTAQRMQLRTQVF